MSKTQDPIKTKDLERFLKFAVSGHVENEKDVKHIKRIARTAVTATDVVVMFKALGQQQEQAITQLMDVVQIQDRVLAKLGATDELYKEAEAEYEAELAAKRAELTEAQKKLEAEKEAAKKEGK
ncbi:hypothetical protein P59_119 [Bacillus phage P59]|nr:hypothetical protein P59_119 [Bacillus phage P59]